MTTDPAGGTSLWSRIGWFVLLWAGGVVTVGIVAYAIRLALRP